MFLFFVKVVKVLDVFEPPKVRLISLVEPWAQGCLSLDLSSDLRMPFIIAFKPCWPHLLFLVAPQDRSEYHHIYIVMETVYGTDLHGLLVREETEFTEDQLRFMIFQCLSGAQNQHKTTHTHYLASHARHFALSEPSFIVFLGRCSLFLRFRPGLHASFWFGAS